MIDIAVRTILRNDATLISLVGDRIYWINKPDNQAITSLILQHNSTERPHTFEGAAGYIKGNIRISCLAPEYAECKELADAVRLCLDSYTGTEDNTVINYLLVSSDTDISHSIPEGADKPILYGVYVDAEFNAVE